MSICKLSQLEGGDSARVAYPLFQVEDGGSIPTSPLQFQLYEISMQRAKKLNAMWHSRLPIYQSGMMLKAKICYGAFYKGKIYAVAIWDNPTARALPQQTWLELKRMAISPDAPKNTASRMLAVMAKLVKRQLSSITMLISYQDTEVHTGTIYKASGWCVGKHSKGHTWYSAKSKDKKTGRARLRPDLNKATGPKIRWQKEIR